jgi:hypothetical protein
MKDFELTPKMLTLRGEFYPTGYTFVMLPSADDAKKLEQDLRAADVQEPDLLYLTPQAVLSQVAPTTAHHGEALPSVGTESATAHRYRELAAQGHCAVMVRPQSERDADKVMEVIRRSPFSIAEKYRLLAIEDVE